MENNLVNYNEKELLIVGDDNKKLSFVVEQYLDFIKEVDEKEKLFKNDLKNVMLENGLYSEKIGKYNISIAFPKSTETLDEEKLITNEEESVLIPFILTHRNESFDVEKLKEKYPEIYKEFYHEDIDLTIDSERLKKMRPDLYDKYKVVTPSTKEPYLVVKESKK